MLRPVAGGRPRLNLTEKEADTATMFEPEAYARLREIKAKADPDSVFCGNHAIEWRRATHRAGGAVPQRTAAARAGGYTASERRSSMPRYLLLKHYRGGPEPYRPFPPMNEWEPEDVDAHMAFLRRVTEMLKESGEYVDGQALRPERTWVRYGGPEEDPVTADGSSPEASELIAGWYMIDVDSRERALELAAHVSSEPGPGGEPLYEWIDVREVM